jgi:hypothetical protein
MRWVCLLTRKCGSACWATFTAADPPSPYDRVLAARFGIAAAELIAEGKFGKMVALRSDSIVAVNILWSGGRLAWRSAVGLLDYSDPETDQQIREKLDAICHELGVHYHGVRCCTTGYRNLIEVHLLFPQATAVGGRIDWRLRSKNVCRWN